MNQGLRTSMEGLEGRVLFSSTLFSTGLCLPPSSAPTPSGPVVSSPPPTGGRHHHHRAPSSAVPVALVPLVLGQWQGDVVDANGPVGSTLAVNVTQSRTGELFAKLGFTGSVMFGGSAQFTYDSVTQHFRAWVVSPRLVVKIEGKPFVNSDFLPEFQGEIQFYTRTGAFKGQFTLQQSDIQPRPAL
jgi:hypothetical protein